MGYDKDPFKRYSWLGDGSPRKYFHYTMFGGGKFPMVGRVFISHNAEDAAYMFEKLKDLPRPRHYHWHDFFRK